MGKRIVFLVVALVAVLALTGCGSDSSSLSNGEYTNELKLACNKGEQEIEELVSQINQDYYEKREQAPTTDYQVENLLKVIASYKAITEKIADIGLPEGDEKKAEELIEAREVAAAKVEASPLGTRDTIPQIFKPANELAEDLGATTCFF